MIPIIIFYRPYRISDWDDTKEKTNNPFPIEGKDGKFRKIKVPNFPFNPARLNHKQWKCSCCNKVLSSFSKGYQFFNNPNYTICKKCFKKTQKTLDK